MLSQFRRRVVWLRFRVDLPAGATCSLQCILRSEFVNVLMGQYVPIIPLNNVDRFYVGLHDTE